MEWKEQEKRSERIYGVPSEEILGIMESLRKSKKIKFVPSPTEWGAALMGATEGRLTGRCAQPNPPEPNKADQG
ncbi:thiamine pyrophosphate-binding protein [Rhizobium leguminosarum]|uniref:thiamine pyrophosphate-binding protein n=1 Tax=Rhizobium leguminosarum TaxID=384 RepID=UPI001C97BF1F|nr:thiamine pyrophosphate-binding protein [Rhizobium leguminosarum]MBY5579031.1 hypothetical protein [Rhizobium leguminosarum]